MGSTNYKESFLAKIAVGGGIVDMKTAIDVKTAHLLSISILELAQKTLHRCTKRKKTGPIVDILEVYILVAVSLEAFINEVCVEKINEYEEPGKNTKCLEGIMLEWIMYGNNGRGMEIRGKWEYLPKCLWNRQPDRHFDKGKQPWQDFVALIKLRNDLVHYKAGYQETKYIPKYLKPIVQRVLSSPRGKPQPQGFLERLTDDSLHWINIISNIEMGSWAFATGKKMIRQFLDFMDQGDPIRQDYIELLGKIKGIRG